MAYVVEHKSDMCRKITHVVSEVKLQPVTLHKQGQNTSRNRVEAAAEQKYVYLKETPFSLTQLCYAKTADGVLSKQPSWLSAKYECKYECICDYAYIYINMYTYKLMCIRVYVYVCVYVYEYVYVYVYIYVFCICICICIRK